MEAPKRPSQQPPATPYAELLAVAIEATQRAGDVMRQHRNGGTVSVTLKGTRDLVTNADVAAEKVIIELIKSRFPDHLILAEESAPHLDPTTLSNATVWTIDPIDGTTNYAHGHPFTCSTVACVLDGTCVAGAVFAPFLNDLFAATKGGGATLNGTPIHVSQATTLEHAVLATGFPYNRANITNICKRLERVLRRCRDLRRDGAAALDLCSVARGWFDAYFEETVRPWDAAAGALIAREAGAVVGHYPYDAPNQKLTHGYPGDLFVDNLIVSTPGIFDQLLAELSSTVIETM